MRVALEAIQDIKAPRKVGILGDMLELGKYTITAHEGIGRLAGKTFDILITVGDRAKFIASAAQKAGLLKRNIHSFGTADEALEAALKIIHPQDLILIKASRAMRLETITAALTAK